MRSDRVEVQHSAALTRLQLVRRCRRTEHEPPEPRSLSLSSLRLSSDRSQESPCLSIQPAFFRSFLSPPNYGKRAVPDRLPLA